MIDTQDFLDDNTIPPLAKNLVLHVGKEATFKLISKFGGTRIYIPQDPPDNHVLVELLGKSVAQKLGRFFGKEVIVIPSLKRWKLKNRNLAIVKEYKKDEISVAAIARLYNISERHVYNIIMKFRKEMEE